MLAGEQWEIALAARSYTKALCASHPLHSWVATAYHDAVYAYPYVHM
jgi:hypothetical protein